MRTLFARFLLWFWLGLAVLLAVEIALETHSLREGLEVRQMHGADPHAIYADLARVTLAHRGSAGLDSLIVDLAAVHGIEAYRVDSGARPGPLGDIDATGLAALKGHRSTLVETRNGLFVGYPIGAAGHREIALVIHPVGASEPRGGRALPLVPEDLGIRALITLLFGGVGCFLLARSITAPVKALREATRRIAAGDLSARSGASGRSRRDELVDLGRDFDRMAERLEALVHAQRRLLTDISHELRSPLARMNVALALLRDRSGAHPDEMIDRLELESHRLDQLIGDVLTLSRAEADEPMPELRSIELGALASEIADDARFEASGSVTDVEVHRDESVTVSGVPGLLRSALDNVVRNAVRHTAPGTTVDITVRREDDEAVITVLDHGPGVPASQLDEIFEPFFRIESTSHSRGTGLGLTIARRIVAQHGGSIRADAAPGQGLQVTVRLPSSPPNDATPRTGSDKPR